MASAFSRFATVGDAATVYEGIQAPRTRRRAPTR